MAIHDHLVSGSAFCVSHELIVHAGVRALDGNAPVCTSICTERLAEAAPARVAASLWHTCDGAVRRGLPEPVVTELDGARVQLALPVEIGAHALRRLHGCLEDAALDRVQAVVTVRMVARNPPGATPYPPQGAREADR